MGLGQERASSESLWLGNRWQPELAVKQTESSAAFILVEPQGQDLDPGLVQGCPEVVVSVSGSMGDTKRGQATEIHMDAL